jgi:acyl-CoA thioester hydrolase
MGIVHHRNYLVYFEEGRSSYARQRNRPYSDFERAGFFLTVTDASLRYRQPARYDQQITIRTWIAEMKSRGMTFAYEVVDAATDTLLVEGTTRHICITREGRVAPIPDDWRAWG